MSETELFAAVHAYGDAVRDPDGFEYYHFDSEARAKLLEAIRAWVKTEMQQVAVDSVLNSTADTVVLLLAKAAVCDAFLAPQGEDYDRNIGKALKALEALQAREPKR